MTLYPPQNPEELEPEYSEHLKALHTLEAPYFTRQQAEQVAAQLAQRDRENKRLSNHIDILVVERGISDARAESNLAAAQQELAELKSWQMVATATIAKLESESDASKQETARLHSKWRMVLVSVARLLCERGGDFTDEFLFSLPDEALAVVGQRDTAQARVRELEAGPGVRFSQTPGGDDGDFVCVNCGLIVLDEEHGHSWEACAKSLSEDRVRIIDGMCDDVGRELSKNESLESRLRELTEWRPMESAPKDGSTVALMISDGVATVGAWCKETAVWDTQYCTFEDKPEDRPPEHGEEWPVGWLPLPSAGGGR